MIVIVTYSDYPNGSPGSIRYETFAQAYRDIGCRVMVLHKSVTVSDATQEQSVYTKNKFERYLLFGYRIICSIRKLKQTDTIDGIVVGTDVSALHATIIKAWCRLTNIKCIFDVTEWYSKEQVSNWLISVPYWDKEITNRFVISKRSRVIAISSYLYDYFQSKGCLVTNIPIIYNHNHNDVIYDENTLNVALSKDLKIIYAGSHLLMDNIPLLIQAIALVPENVRMRIKFTIYGLSESRIKSCVSEDDWNTAKDSLHIMGRRANSEVVRAYAQTDFSVLLRDPSLRVNKAGFPSKVVESMRMGVPVICNYSSDLHKYLNHKENSIIVDNLDASVVATLLQELVEMPYLERDRISRNARQTIYDKLDTKLFEDNFKYIVS